MGARAVGNFDNDAARDWLYDFGENDFRLIDRTLAGVAGMIAADELDAWEAQEVLVAAECVAAAAGFPPPILDADQLAKSPAVMLARWGFALMTSGRTNWAIGTDGSALRTRFASGAPRKCAA